MNSYSQKKASVQIETGSVSFFCLFLVTVLFVLAFVPIQIVQAYHDAPKLEPYSEQNADPEDPSEQDFVPIFAPSSVVIKPYSAPETVVYGAEDKTVDSQYAVLLDAETGEILAGKQSSVQFSPASMTKVMTLIVACENLSAQDLERKIPFTKEIHEYVTTGQYKDMERVIYEEVGGESTYGDRFFIKDLLYFIGIKSAADCTYMIVRDICDTEAEFVAMMNQKARDMGLNHTVFDNVVGFDSPGNQTTAEEMAVIMAYAMQNELIADILKDTGEQEHILYGYYFDAAGNEKSYRHNKYLKNTFSSRKQYYDSFELTTSRLDATKTGYTNESFIVCMATSKQTGRKYVLVLGNKKTDYVMLKEKFKATMIDIEFLYNTYVK